MATSWINEIIFKKGPKENQTETTFPIGVTFDQVYYSSSNWFSLSDVITNLTKFFSRQGFMLYSRNEPTIYSNTMEWYALGGDTTAVDSDLTVDDPNEEVYDTVNNG